jgi:hypothetical protein
MRCFKPVTIAPSIKQLVVLRVSFHGQRALCFDFPGGIIFGAFRRYVAGCFVGRHLDAIALERSEKPMRRNNSVQAGEVEVRFTDRSDSMLHFTTKFSKGVRLLPPRNAAWAWARITFEGILEIECYLIGAWYGELPLRSDDRLLPLQQSMGPWPFILQLYGFKDQLLVKVAGRTTEGL